MQTRPSTKDLIAKAEKALHPLFQEVDRVAGIRQRQVLESLQSSRLTEEFFAEKTGYGRYDAGRATIDKIFARALQAEAAAVRLQMVSGTHALACALFGSLSPGQRLACLTGDPYDTLKEVIGIAAAEPGSLRDWGVSYIQGDVVALTGSKQELGRCLAPLVEPPTAAAYIQKSCGYSFGRRALSADDIRVIAAAVRSINPDCIILVDNCYGEFVEENEPTACGADLIAGSLIKNPGGGLALTGGYVAGRARLVERALNRLTAPGIGGHMGLTYNQNRLLLQGLFLAPSVVAQAVKGGMLFAHVFEQLGLDVSPGPFEKRFDIIQAIKFGSAERLAAFCRAIQRCSPVNAHVVPEPADMPGYQQAVVMAGGTFIEGSTIELSADGPVRPPYAAYVQGGLTYLHIRYALERALELSASGECPFLPG